MHGVAERNIDEDGLHEDESSCVEDGDANGGDDPVNTLTSGPAEDEKASDRSETSEESGNKATFLNGEPFLLYLGGLGNQNCEVDGDANDAGHKDAEKDEGALAQRHSVHDWVNHGERLEKGIVDAINDTGVDLDEEDGGILDGDL